MSKPKTIERIPGEGRDAYWLRYRHANRWRRRRRKLAEFFKIGGIIGGTLAGILLWIAFAIAISAAPAVIVILVLRAMGVI